MCSFEDCFMQFINLHVFHEDLDCCGSLDPKAGIKPMCKALFSLHETQFVILCLHGSI